MDEKKITKNIRTKLIVVISITFLLCVLGLSYAYFTIQVGGNEEASSIDVTAARLSLIYTDVQIVMGDLEKPGWTDTKVFTVENDGTDTVPYIIKWRELENTLVNDELVISATCSSNIQGKTCANIPETPVPTALAEVTNVYVFGPVPIEPGEIHTYTLTTTFKETGSVQNYNQDRYFNGTLNIGDGTPTDESCFTTTGSTTLSITGYDETCGTDVIIPSTINGKTVVQINSNAFKEKGLTSVVIPNSVTNIGPQSFISNNLTSITIPNSVVKIEGMAFMNNQITSVVIPSNVTNIHGQVFQNNNLASLVLHPNITYSNGNSQYSNNQLTYLEIPSGTTSITDSMFKNNNLQSVIIPNGITSIPYEAFSNNQLTSVEIPNSVTTIGRDAFKNNQLTSIVIPNNVTSIGNDAFKDNQLTSVVIPNSVTTIGTGSFKNNSLTSLEIPSGITSISDGAFSNNQLTSLTIPNNVTTIENGAFDNNPLKSLSLGSGVTTIGKSFMNNKLSTIIIPSNVTSIATGAFFVNDSGQRVLNTVIMQGKTTSADFTSADFSDSTWSWKGVVTCTRNNTSNVTNGCIIWVDNSSTFVAGDYAYTVSGNNATIVKYAGTDANLVIPSSLGGKSVKTIGQYSINYNNDVTSIVIPEGVTDIGRDAFSHNTSLTSITFPSTLRTIGRSTFYDDRLTSITLPNGLTTIGQTAFYGNRLSTLTIPSSVTTINNNAFQNNILESIIIEGKSSSSQFATYSPGYGYASGVTCTKNNTSNVTNGCITWLGN